MATTGEAHQLGPAPWTAERRPPSSAGGCSTGSTETTRTASGYVAASAVARHGEGGRSGSSMALTMWYASGLPRQVRAET